MLKPAKVSPLLAATNVEIQRNNRDVETVDEPRQVGGAVGNHCDVSQMPPQLSAEPAQ